MKKIAIAAAALSAFALTACGGGTTTNSADTNLAIGDDLNTSEPLEETTLSNDAGFNESDLNTLAPVDDPALSNTDVPADNALANAL